MKNKLVAGGLALLTAFALVACTTPNPSENGPSETSQQEGSSSHGGNSGESNSGTGSSSSETQVTDWTDAQKAVMTSHLGGRVLPFMSIPEATVTWYDEFACVSIESKKATEADTNAYRGILTNDGYVFTYNESYGYWDAVKTFSNFDKIEIQNLPRAAAERQVAVLQAELSDRCADHYRSGRLGTCFRHLVCDQRSRGRAES